MIRETYPSGREVHHEIDANGDLERVWGDRAGTSSTYANAFNYNKSAVEKMRLGNGKWENTVFNSRMQPTKIGLGTGVASQDLLKLEYEYGATASVNNGNVTKQTITVPGVAQLFIQTYTYDELNRLTSAEEIKNSVQQWEQTFTYDRYGNRNFNEGETTTLPKNCGSSPSFTVCAADKKIVNPSVNTANNRLSTSDNYAFDNAGNTTADAEGRTFVYDAENKQVSVSDGTGTIGQYFYDGDGKRIKKYIPDTGETTIFVYDGGGKLIQEHSTIVQPVQDAETVYTTNDHLGSPRINTDATGQVISRHDYHPFGEEIARPGHGSDTIRKQFTGYERDDETGLDYAQARMYSKGLGRFTTTDPIIISKDHPASPQRWNLYVYVINNPLNLTDPDGMKPRIIDVFITYDQTSKEGREAWSRLRREARKKGVIINIFREGDGTATSKNFIKSITTAGRTTVLVGHSVQSPEGAKKHKGFGLAFQTTGEGGVIRDDVADKKSVLEGYGQTTLDGLNAKAENIAIFSCSRGAVLDKLGSTTSTNLFYNTSGTLGGTGADANNQAAFRITEAFANGADASKALEAARNGFDAFRGAQDLDGDAIEHKVLKPVNP